MDTDLVFGILSAILIVICACMGYNGWYSKYANLAVVILNALKDGKITEDELDDIKAAYEACKSDED